MDGTSMRALLEAAAPGSDPAAIVTASQSVKTFNDGRYEEIKLGCG